MTLDNTPVSDLAAGNGQSVPGLLSNVATITRDQCPTNTNQTNIQPVYDVYASVQGRDLGGVAADIDKIVADAAKATAPGNTIQVIGQIQSMSDAFRDLGIGLLFAAVLGLSADGRELSELRRPVRRHSGAAGDLLRHRDDAVHHRHDSERAVADGRDHGGRRRFGELDPARHLRARAAAGGHDRRRGGASSAGHTRIRPVLMTAAAMIVGMIPMAIGGAGEEQNAALARAVIGGLLFATPTTLLVVPYLFAMLRKGNDGQARPRRI